MNLAFGCAWRMVVACTVYWVAVYAIASRLERRYMRRVRGGSGG